MQLKSRALHGVTARTMFRTGFILCALVTGPTLHRVTAETMHLHSVRLCRSMAETADWYCGLSQVTTAMAILSALLVAVSCIIQALRGQLAQPVLSGSGKEPSIALRHRRGTFYLRAAAAVHQRC